MHIVEEEEPFPTDMTHRHGLICLFSLQQWESMPPRTDPYAPGYFYNAIFGMLKGLATPSRGLVVRHLLQATCLACEASVDITKSTFDHLIPQAEHGTNALGNAIVLCRRCNSSKGKKPFLDWWQEKGYAVEALPREIICLYARIFWQSLDHDALQEPCPPMTRRFIQARAARLPTQKHRVALYGAAVAGAAFYAWEHQRTRL